jgi:hypothetical protein
LAAAVARLLQQLLRQLQDTQEPQQAPWVACCRWYLAAVLLQQAWMYRLEQQLLKQGQRVQLLLLQLLDQQQLIPCLELALQLLLLRPLLLVHLLQLLQLLPRHRFQSLLLYWAPCTTVDNSKNYCHGDWLVAQANQPFPIYAEHGCMYAASVCKGGARSTQHCCNSNLSPRRPLGAGTVCKAVSGTTRRCRVCDTNHVSTMHQCPQLFLLANRRLPAVKAPGLKQPLLYSGPSWQSMLVSWNA